MAKEDPVVGYVAVAVAVICFGSFAVPAKWASVRAANVHPLVYQTYKTFWCFATSWLALLVPGVQLVFTPFGVLSAVAWVPAGTLAIASIGRPSTILNTQRWQRAVAHCTRPWTPRTPWHGCEFTVPLGDGGVSRWSSKTRNQQTKAY